MKVYAVGIGGFVGAMLRYLIGGWIPVTNGFPFGTLTINLAGCLFLAWFFTVTAKRFGIHPHLIAAIGTGLTGSFTTFSTFSVETTYLLSANQVGFAILYILSSVLGGIGLAIVGTTFANRYVRRV